MVGRAYGTTSTGLNPEGREWNPHCDINDDSKIDIKDYYLVCKNQEKRIHNYFEDDELGKHVVWVWGKVL